MRKCATALWPKPAKVPVAIPGASVARDRPLEGACRPARDPPGPGILGDAAVHTARMSRTASEGEVGGDVAQQARGRMRAGRLTGRRPRAHGLCAYADPVGYRAAASCLSSAA